MLTTIHQFTSSTTLQTVLYLLQLRYLILLFSNMRITRYKWYTTDCTTVCIARTQFSYFTPVFQRGLAVFLHLFWKRNFEHFIVYLNKKMNCKHQVVAKRHFSVYATIT